MKLLLLLPLLLGLSVPAIAHNEANGGESTCDICQEGMDDEEDNEEENEEDEYDLCMLNRESYTETCE